VSDLLPAAILCGGLGTRLGAQTRNLPKCLIDVNGRPFLSYVLEECSRQRIRKVVLCVGHLGWMIEQSTRSRETYGLDIRYSYDGFNAPLGTAGALQNAQKLLGDQFFTIYGDSFLQVSYKNVQAHFQREQCLGLMVVCKPPEGYKPNVWFQKGRIVSHLKRWYVPKAHHIDYGMGMLDARALILIDEMPYDLSDLFGVLATARELAGYVSPERFYTIGTPTSLALTREHLADARNA